MKFVVPAIFTAVDKLTPPVRGMTRTVETFGSRADRVFSKWEKSYKKMPPLLDETTKQFLKFASAASIAAGIVGGGVFSVKSIMDYETELANLQAVTGASGKDFDLFKQKIKSVAEETKTSAVNVAQAFTAIANNQPALLKDANALAAVTKSSIILAQASKMELGPAGEALTQILNQYGQGAEYAAKTIDILAAGSVAGSSEIRDTADAIQKFGTVAANANIGVKESVALIELASRFQKGAEAGEKLRNILIVMSTARVQDPKAVKDMRRLGVNMKLVMDRSVPLVDRLKEMAKISKDDAALFHVFGKENQAMATGILNNAAAFSSMLEQVNKDGEAARMAAKNNDTLARRVEQLKDKFVTWLVTSDQANIALGYLKRAAIFLADNLVPIIKYTSILVGLFLAWRTGVLLVSAGMFIYGVALGVYNAVTGTATVYTKAQTVAMYSQKIATGILTGWTYIMTAAQWALNAAMAANPVAIVVIAVLALVAALGYVIANYKTIEELHQKQVSANKKKGFEDETKQIDAATKSYEKYGNSAAVAHEKALRDSKLYNKDEATRISKQLSNASTDRERRIATDAMATLEGRMQAVNQQSEPAAKTLNPKVVQQNMYNNSTQTNNAAVDINIKDPKGMVESASASTGKGFLNIKTSSTLGN